MSFIIYNLATTPREVKILIQHLCRPILWALLLSSLSVVASAQQLIRYNISLELADRKQSYYVDLLTLVLEKTVVEYGAYKLEPVVMEMSPGRAAIMVEQDDGIDIIWRMTSVDLEQRLAPVYWPLLKGMMGYRIFIIRAERQHDFTPTMHREDLKSLVAGQGIDWADAKILDKNGFSLIKSGTFRLLDMLDKGRFDYFPRALHEPWVEITNRPQFVVEKNILLKYVAPMFFFVRKDNLLLQQ